MSETVAPSPKPVVASYCTTFLKPEMLHIYRQVTGLRRHGTFVVTRERMNEAQMPFSDVEVLPPPRKNFVKRFWLKYIAGKPPLSYRGELQVLLQLLGRRPADLMHIYFGHTAVHLLPFIQEWKQPCVVSFHGMDIQARPQQTGYDEQMRAMLRTVPLVLARSKSLLGRLEQMGCPRGKLRLNRTGIPLGDFPFQQRPRPADGSWRFVQACRLIEKKGLATSIRAFAKFHERQRRAKFVIAGDGPMRAALTALATELGVGEAVEFRGFVAQPELAGIFARAQVFLHPSEMPADQNQEGVPNSMLEAMATGLPVLASSHGGIPEAVTHERTGLLVPEKDVEGLFRAMCRITEPTDTLHLFGQAASAAVREEFEQGKQIEKLEGYYDEARALGKNPGECGMSPGT